jgi:hypothetical protein
MRGMRKHGNIRTIHLFIYVSIIGPIYATGSDYGDTAASIMHDYFMWDDEEKDWEEYILWREGK